VQFFCTRCRRRNPKDPTDKEAQFFCIWCKRRRNPKDPADKAAQFFCTRCRRRRSQSLPEIKRQSSKPQSVTLLSYHDRLAVPTLRATMTHECHVRPHEFLHRRQMENSLQLQAPSPLFSSEITLCTHCIMLSHPDVLMEQIIFSHGDGYRCHLLY